MYPQGAGSKILKISKMSLGTDANNGRKELWIAVGICP